MIESVRDAFARKVVFFIGSSVLSLSPVEVLVPSDRQLYARTVQNCCFCPQPTVNIVQVTVAATTVSETTLRVTEDALTVLTDLTTLITMVGGACTECASRSDILQHWSSHTTEIFVSIHHFSCRCSEFDFPNVVGRPHSPGSVENC